MARWQPKLGFISGLYRDHGKEHGNYYKGGYTGFRVKGFRV